jgi:hypothetical protein
LLSFFLVRSLDCCCLRFFLSFREFMLPLLQLLPLSLLLLHCGRSWCHSLAKVTTAASGNECVSTSPTNRKSCCKKIMDPL